MIVFLDTGVLGLVASPKKTGDARDCKEWLFRLLSRGVYFVTSDLCDYEVRRGLILASFSQPLISGIDNLNSLPQLIDFLPLIKDLMKKTAQIWAEARNQAIPTADNKNIDGDIILLPSGGF